VKANTGGPVSGGSLDPALLHRFTMAEGALYPLAITDPERYQRAVVAVGLVARLLREDCTSIADLVRWLPSAERVVQVAADEDVSLADLDPVAIADAAAALRYRELQSGGATHLTG
jgi:hypothetical protein